MPAIKKEIVTFVVGAGLSAAGIASLPLSEILLTGGSALLALSYGSLLMGWRTGAQPRNAKAGSSSPGQPAYTPSPSAQPQPVSAHTSPSPPAMPSTPSTSGVQAPTSPSSPTAAMPPPPSAPAIEQPKPTGRKLPSIKAPKIVLPKSISEHRVPIALLGVGVILVVGAIALLVPSNPSVAGGAGLLILGALSLGVGTILLLRRPAPPAAVVVEVRRFCMHCGFQMSSADVSCPRCRRQPPSGVDTKVCPNCEAVIPTQAKFCRDCGAGQPAASAPS